MVRVEDAIVARLTKGEHKFEILVDPVKAQEFKDGKAKIEDVLAVREVFKDVKAAERASTDLMKDVFKTSDPLRVAEEIIRRGMVQLTTEQRRKMVEETRNRVINFIVQNAIDPRTGLPHPRTRIENALSEIRMNLDPFKPAEEQVDQIITDLRPILPLKFEKKKLAIKFPAQYAHHSYGYAKSLGIQKEQWLNDGSLVVVIEIPGGLQNEVIDRVNSLTKGSGEVKIL